MSQSLDASLFKYVKFQRLLEAEVGVTRNEPVQLAVTEAIEKAVEGLIIEGVEDNLWKVKDGQDQDVLIQAYRQEKQEADLESVYGGKLVQRTYSSSLTVNLGGSLISGDFNSPELGSLWSRLTFLNILTIVFISILEQMHLNYPIIRIFLRNTRA